MFKQIKIKLVLKSAPKKALVIKMPHPGILNAKCVSWNLIKVKCHF